MPGLRYPVRIPSSSQAPPEKQGMFGMCPFTICVEQAVFHKHKPWDAQKGAFERLLLRNSLWSGYWGLRVTAELCSFIWKYLLSANNHLFLLPLSIPSQTFCSIVYILKVAAFCQGTKEELFPFTMHALCFTWKYQQRNWKIVSFVILFVLGALLSFQRKISLPWGPNPTHSQYHLSPTCLHSSSTPSSRDYPHIFPFSSSFVSTVAPPFPSSPTTREGAGPGIPPRSVLKCQ